MAHIRYWQVGHEVSSAIYFYEWVCSSATWGAVSWSPADWESSYEKLVGSEEWIKYLLFRNIRNWTVRATCNICTIRNLHGGNEKWAVIFHQFHPMHKVSAFILYGTTYFKTIRKSTAVVMMTKLEKSTAMALTDRNNTTGLEVKQHKTQNIKPSKLHEHKI